jgi:hypothetical protein
MGGIPFFRFAFHYFLLLLLQSNGFYAIFLLLFIFYFYFARDCVSFRILITGTTTR